MARPTLLALALALGLGATAGAVTGVLALAASLLALRLPAARQGQLPACLVLAIFADGIVAPLGFSASTIVGTAMITKAGSRPDELVRALGSRRVLVVAMSALGVALLVAFVSAASAAAPGIALAGALRLGWLALLAAAVIAIGLHHRDRERVLDALVLGAVVATAWGAFVAPPVAGRLAGSFGDPNYFAAALLGSVLVGLGRLASPRRGWRRPVDVAALVTCLAALAATGSRGGMLGLGVGVVALVALTPRLRRSGAAFGAACIGVALAVPTTSRALAGMVERTRAEGLSGRADLWQATVDAWQTAPVLGLGFDNSQVAALAFRASEGLRGQPTVLAAHNTPLQLLADLGIVGVTALAVACSILLVAQWRAVAREAAAPLPAVAGGVLLSTQLALGASFLFLTAWDFRLAWVCAVVALADTPALGAAMGRRGGEIVELDAWRATSELDASTSQPMRLPRAS